MAGSSIFVTYGLKSGGGAPFLRRTRNAVGQLQKRTRTAGNTSQLQTQTRSSSCAWHTVVYKCADRRQDCYHGQGGTICDGFRYPSHYEDWANPCGQQVYKCTIEEGRRSFGNWGGWSNVSDCSGSTTRRCQTVNVCAFSTFTDWLDTSSCDSENPACTTGAVNTECRTTFVFREEDWSPFEEVETCESVSPNPEDGAVAVECIAN